MTHSKTKTEGRRNEMRDTECKDPGDGSGGTICCGDKGGC